jgi:predicted nucleic acid-binding protein
LSVFVDTSAFVAFALRRDDRHVAARTCFRALMESRTQLVTSDWVFGETVSFVRRRAGYSVAREAGERLRESPSLEIVSVDKNTVEEAWESFVGYRFDDLSLVDCVSFTLMRSRKIRKVFTFDRHFREAGFDLLPSEKR